MVALPAAKPASASTPSPVIPLAVRIVHSGRCGVQRLDRRGRVVDQVALGQHDDRPGAAVPRQHQLALQAGAGWAATSERGRASRRRCWRRSSATRRGCPRTMRGARRRCGAAARPRPGRAPTDGTTQSPTATSAPMLRIRSGSSSRLRRTVLHPRSRRVTLPGSSESPVCSPRRVQLLAPAESNVTSFVDSAESSVGHEATADDRDGRRSNWRGPHVLARLARFSFRKRWIMVFAIWLPLLFGLQRRQRRDR